jgi:SpoVK/Ycf46/Vps4 family AAA+-type ATPase
MAVERLYNALSINSGNRFMILYGEGLDDVFITESYEQVSIETALHEALKELGFERIAFVSPHRPVYYLDQLSQDLSIPSGIQHSLERHPDEMRILIDGPLSNRFLLPERSYDSRSSTDGMGDIHAIRLLDTLIRDDQGPKTAIVILQSEAVLQYFEDPRSLAGLMGSWANLPAGNPNKCLFLFTGASHQRLIELAHTLPVPEIRDGILANQSVAGGTLLNNISLPGESELCRLLTYYQMQGSLSLGEDPFTLATWLSTEMISIRQWISRLSTIDQLDRVIARRQGWISAVRDSGKSAEERISDLVGLHMVKQHLSEMSAWLYLHKQRDQKSELPLLHLVFTGNPGTGKTTVARLIGEIYRDLGYLKRGHLIEARAADLIAGFVGGTSERTDQVIDQAIDGVLFIDEAYMLTEPDRGGFGQEAVDTLMSRMENDRSQLVVIVAGYPEKMRHFLQSNPGLARRFPIENHFDFPDFSPEELTIILFRLLSDRAISVEENVCENLKAIVQGLFDGRDRSFGNAGEMRNFCEAIDRKRAIRILRNNEAFDSPLSLDDIPDKYRAYLAPDAPDMDHLFEGLKDLIGLKDVKMFVRRLGLRLELEQLRRQQNPNRSLLPTLQHLVFIGNPGTGKTTIARIIGQLYRAIGLLKKGHVIEVSRPDLVAGYVGQTALKTMEKVKDALDGVLFIDEAYNLFGGNNSDYGQEVIDTLVKAMEDYRGRLVVIVAGYPQEMENFLNSNPGLRSRFSQPIAFPDYSMEELGEILRQLSKRDGYILKKPILERVLEYIELVRRSDGRSFGNARTVQMIFECMKDSLAERVLANKKGSYSKQRLSTFHIDDVPVPVANIIPNDLRYLTAYDGKSNITRRIHQQSIPAQP